MSSEAEATEDFPYREISRLAVVSVVLMLFGCLGLMSGFEWMLAAGILGTVLALAAMSRIRKFPNEFAGMESRGCWFVLNLAVVAGGIGKATYIYLTEVPDGYERVEFASLESSKDAPDLPTPTAIELNGKQIFLKGYVHSASGSGRLRRLSWSPI